MRGGPLRAATVFADAAPHTTAPTPPYSALAQLFTLPQRCKGGKEPPRQRDGGQGRPWPRVAYGRP